MKESWIHLLQQCIWSWLHGFSTKTGGELWFRRSAMMENLRYPKDSQRRDF